MKTQKIMNLLNKLRNKESKFDTRKWYVIESQLAKGKYNQSKSTKFETVALVGKTTGAADQNRFVENTTVVVPLKYLNKCW